MVSRSVFIFGCLLLALCSSGSLVLAETGCPPAETITPCICDDRTTPRLVCSSVMSPSVLEQVFKNCARYNFQEVHIQSSSLLYLPSMMFDEVQINELYVNDSHFVSLFMDAPASSTLEKLQLDKTKFQRGFLNNVNLTKFTSLKTLIVNNVDVLTLRPTLNRNLPSSLKQITLHGTRTKGIMPAPIIENLVHRVNGRKLQSSVKDLLFWHSPHLFNMATGAFDSFPYLDKLQVSSGKLTHLSRDMFPTVFNVRFLYFDNNNLTSIPNDLFTDMPELQFLSMKNNYITEVPEAAFGKRRTTIPYLRFDGNPLKCNCLLIWLVKNKPEIIGGTCHSPRNLVGKQLQDLLPGDFNC